MAERDELGDIADQGPWEREDDGSAGPPSDEGTGDEPPTDELPPAAEA